MKFSSLLIAAALIVAPAMANAQNYFYDFNVAGSVGSEWTPDRKAPATFQSSGGNLVIGVDAGDFDSLNNFNNTQGKSHVANSGGQEWLSGAEFMLTADFFGTSPRRAGLWMRTSSDGTEANAQYHIIDMFNDGTTTVARVWDDDLVGGWYNIAGIFDSSDAGSFLFEIAGTSTGVNFSIRGGSVYTDNTVDAPLDATNSILQVSNYGESYSVNVNEASFSAVPEPSASMLGLIALGGLLTRRKR